MSKNRIIIIALTLFFTISSVVYAHPGRTDSKGGHTCRTNCAKWGLKTGEYHYHNGSGNSTSSNSSSSTITTKSPSIKVDEKATNTPQALKVTLPEFVIKVNNEIINNAEAQYPVFVYKDITYFPMTWNFTQALAIDTKWDTSEGLSINKTDNKAAKLNQDATSSTNTKLQAKLPSFKIHINHNIIDNSIEEYPLLVLNDVTYLPMTWKFAVEELGLTINLDPNTFNLSK